MVNINGLKADKKEKKSLTQAIAKHWKKSGAAMAIILLSGVAACGDPNDNRAVAPQEQVPPTTETEGFGTETPVGETPDQREGFGSETPVGETPTQTEGFGTETPVGEAPAQTEELIGQTVTINGEVEEIVGSNSFVVQDQDNVLNEDQVLVISVSDQNQPIISEGENVQVTGEVRQFVVEDFERDYNLTLDEERRQQLASEYQGRAVVVTDLVNVQ